LIISGRRELSFFFARKESSMTRTITTVTARLEMYYEAERRVLLGQSYTIGNRQLTRANLAEIRKAIRELEDEVEGLAERPRAFSKRVVFRD